MDDYKNDIFAKIIKEMNKKQLVSTMVSIFFFFFVVFPTTNMPYNSTFAYFDENFNTFSITLTIIGEITAIFYMRAKMNKYGLVAFWIAIISIPIISFASLPKFYHYFNISNTKEVTLKGVIDRKWKMGANNPEIYIKVDGTDLAKIDKNFRPKSYIIKTVISEGRYKKLKEDDIIEFSGTLSLVGFDFYKIIRKNNKKFK